MMKQDKIMGYIYSLFGKAINYVQIIEKGIMNSIILYKLEDNLSLTRYYELLFEYYTKTTGQLLREFNEIVPKKDISLFSEFHNIRDFLSHQFWWEANIGFDNQETIEIIITELQEYILFLKSLVSYLNNFKLGFEKKHKLLINHEFDEAMYRTSLNEIKKFRKLNKNENIIDLFSYKQSNQVIIPIFQLEDNTFWTVAESGLSQYFYKIIES